MTAMLEDLAVATMVSASLFPFSPLTTEEAERRERIRGRDIAGHIADDPTWFIGSAYAEELRQEFIDLRASTDVRCGYERRRS